MVYNRKAAVKDLERISFDLSSIGTKLSQIIPLLKKTYFKKLRAIELDCTGHATALALISILSKPARKKRKKDPNAGLSPMVRSMGENAECRARSREMGLYSSSNKPSKR